MRCVFPFQLASPLRTCRSICCWRARHHMLLSSPLSGLTGHGANSGWALLSDHHIRRRWGEWAHQPPSGQRRSEVGERPHQWPSATSRPVLLAHPIHPFGVRRNAADPLPHSIASTLRHTRRHQSPLRSQPPRFRASTLCLVTSRLRPFHSCGALLRPSPSPHARRTPKMALARCSPILGIGIA